MWKDIKKLSEERIKICESCEHFKSKSRTCGTPVIGDKVGDKRTCGCFMDVKTKIPFASCPFFLWNVYQVTENDYLAMKELLDKVKHSINPDQKKILFEMKNKYIGGNKKDSNCVPCLKSAMKDLERIVKEYEDQN